MYHSYTTYKIDFYFNIMCFADIYSREQLSAFLAESLIMKDFHHPHVLGLLGVCFDAPDGTPYIVLPFMANGSVKTYLKEKRVHVLDVNSFPKVYEAYMHAYDLTCSLYANLCVNDIRVVVIAVRK